MASLDPLQFAHALLTTFFLASLSVLIPRLLSAASTANEAQNPTFSCWLKNLYRHNPFEQWMAEQRFLADVLRFRFRVLDERKGAFLDPKQCRRLICPNRKWMLLSLFYVLLYATVSVLGALTIMWEESYSTRPKEYVPLYPAFPAKSGHNLMEPRGNCQWIHANGSGSLDKFGFVIYQLCADAQEFGRDEKLRRNEVRAVHNGTYWKLVFSLETLTQESTDEDWKVSAGNEDRLEEAQGLRNYLDSSSCDGDCLGRLRDRGPGYAMIREAMKEVGMVKRKMEHYDISKKDFDEAEVLQDRKSRLTTEAWITMLGVSIVAVLWGLVGIINTEGETDYGIVTRMSREVSDFGPTSIATVLEPGPVGKADFVVRRRGTPRHIVNNVVNDAKNNSATSMDGISKKTSKTLRSADFVEDIEQDEEASVILLRVATYAYRREAEERATDGMIIVAYNESEEEDELE